MAKIRYIINNFKPSSLKVIEQANAILATYAAEGYTLTLRQLYYQFVAKELIPNKVSEYKRLGSIINDARLSGLIDWDAIEDRTRNLHRLSTWESPAHIVSSAAHSYRRDMWQNQSTYVEVWIEKEALAGVFQRVCDSLRVPFFACRGYTSQSEMWGAGQRLAERARAGKEIVILHFGDHDPSGIDMTRDITDRLELFARQSIDIRRLALNMNQVEQYNPPPNPAKDTDTRFQAYLENYGNESWELDALEPKILSNLVSEAVNEYIDMAQWEDDFQTERRHKKQILWLAGIVDEDGELPTIADEE